MSLLDAIRDTEAMDHWLVFGLGCGRSERISGQTISQVLYRAAQAAGVPTSGTRTRRSPARYYPRWGRQTKPRETTAPAYLREWMAERGWTPDSLSVVLGVSPAQLERWRRGVNTPPFHLRRALTMVGAAGAYSGTARPPPEPTEAALRERMAAGGWNDRGLAAALGVSVHTIANWRTGRTTGPRYLLLAIDGAEAGTEAAGRDLAAGAEWSRPDQLRDDP